MEKCVIKNWCSEGGKKNHTNSSKNLLNVTSLFLTDNTTHLWEHRRKASNLSNSWGQACSLSFY